MATSSELPERVRSLRAGSLQPEIARLAATVALVRDGREGLEVYLLRRVRGMSFAAGMHVFPGGSVDPADGSVYPADGSADGSVGSAEGRVEIGWVGPGPQWWADRFSTDPASARALVVAAARETFEESGVLFAGRAKDQLVDDVSGPEWEAEREALEARQQTFAEFLHRRELVLRADLLAPVAHWITPEAEPKRFDTHFFVAALPAGQHPRMAGTEADVRLWIRPEQALSTGLRLMNPTKAVLKDLAGYRDVAAALGAERVIETVFPRLELDGDGDGVRIVV